jgi:hypothetical protein
MRWIDEIIDKVKEHPSIPQIHKLVLIERIEKEPTREELERADRRRDASRSETVLCD